MLSAFPDFRDSFHSFERRLYELAIIADWHVSPLLELDR